MPENETKIIPEKKSRTPSPKPSLYDSILNEMDKSKFHRALKTSGIDDEIALLRVMLMDMWENDPQNNKSVIQAMTLLNRLVRTRHLINHNQNGIAEAVTNVIRDIAVPMGVAVLSKK